MVLAMALSPGQARAQAPRVPAADLCHLVEELPVSVSEAEPGVLLIDFGRVAFGNLKLTPDSVDPDGVRVAFGEKLFNGRIDREPPGSVRFREVSVELGAAQSFVVAPKPDQRNTQQGTAGRPPAVTTPTEWGVITPFRWIEIEGWTGDRSPERFLRRAAFLRSWDDEAASFHCSNPELNAIWELCRYSIKATTFAGVYVDGDRERIPYEADAYINQLGHYATDNDLRMARETFAWLERHPTWPADWTLHMPLLAYADWRHTGDTEWLANQYALLEEDLLLDRARTDGLLETEERMVVDWPKTERDGFVFRPVNTVLNAFHLAALRRMVEMAEAIGKTDDAARYQRRLETASQAFHTQLFDESSGLYVDGLGTDHSSLHANLFPLAFGLIPQNRQQPIVRWLAARGMRCSVYAAQHLLDALFANGADERALALILAPGDRSWSHMLASGTTITWEAWDQRYKPNQDWNHAWGAAPANLLPRHVLGVEPKKPGWQVAHIRPKTSGLAFARGKVPTP